MPANRLHKSSYSYSFSYNPVVKIYLLCLFSQNTVIQIKVERSLSHKSMLLLFQSHVSAQIGHRQVIREKCIQMMMELYKTSKYSNLY
jgi:hypothetical protein